MASMAGTIPWDRYPSDELADLLAGDVADDGARVFFTARDGFGEMKRLSRIHLRRHGWRIGIDDGFDQHRTFGRERLIENRAAAVRVFDDEAGDAESSRDAGKIDRLQVADVFGISEKDHLLPPDLAEEIVLDH